MIRVAILTSVGLVVATWLVACTVDFRRACDSDEDCRYGRLCIGGQCSYAHGSARPTGGGSPSDRPVEDSCEGEPSASLGDLSVRPVAVTTSRYPFRSCCEDVTLQFHTVDVFGFDVRIWIGWFVNMSSQLIDLQAVPEGIDVMVCMDDIPGCEDADLSGTLEIKLDESNHGVEISVCMDIDQPNGELDGAHLFVDRALVAPFGWWDRFAVWLLADPTITGTTAAHQPLDSLELSDMPILDLNGLGFYAPGSFEVGLVEGTLRLLNGLPEFGIEGLPFVVIADGERIFQGAFWTEVSSICPEGVAIYVEPPVDDRVVLEWGCSSPPQDDPRLDPRLLQVLREAQKLVE